LVEKGISDLLKKQVREILVSPNSTQNNDVLVTLITSVNFFRKYALKATSFFKRHHFHFMDIIQKIGVPLDVSFHFLIMESLIPLVALRWRNECLGFVVRDNKQEGSKIKKRKRKKRVEKEMQIIREEAFRATNVIYIKLLGSSITDIHYN